MVTLWILDKFDEWQHTEFIMPYFALPLQKTFGNFSYACRVDDLDIQRTALSIENMLDG